MQATQCTSEGSIPALKPSADLTMSPKEGYQWPHRKDYVLHNFKKTTYFSKLTSSRVKVTTNSYSSFSRRILQLSLSQEFKKTQFITRMHSSRMRTARSLTVSHHKKYACPPWSNHAHPPEQPCMPPWSNHTCPPGATTHAPPSNWAHPPGSNHACPPRSNHARPPMWTE